MNVDHEQLSRELIRALRGERSQLQFSRRLGFSANTVYSWESGRRWPSATRFFQAAIRSGVDLPVAMAPFYKRAPAWLDQEPGSRPWLVSFLEDLRGNTPILTLAERTGHSRFALSRWLSGRSDLQLPALLRFVDAASFRLLDFVALFTPPAELPSTARAWRRLQSARALAWGSPWAPAVLLALELIDYRDLPRHDPGWIASRLGLEPSLVQECLERLVAAGHAQLDGRHYRPSEILSMDVRRGRSGSELKRHWAGVARDLLDREEAIASYNLFTVSEDTLARLRELQRAHVRAVRSLVAESEQAERVVLMNLQLLPIDR